MFRYIQRLLLASALIALLGAVPASLAAPVLSGAGATFPYPLYRRWVSAFFDLTGIRIDYEAIGSGGGIQYLHHRKVDFGATDAFLTDEQMSAFPEPILHIPTCLGAVVLVYNLPGVGFLNLSPEIIVGVYSGDVTHWQDPRIRAVNPDHPLPALPITVVHRSDSSGTSFIFTDYLSKISDTWRDTVGFGKQVEWPVGMGLDRNANIAEFVRKIPGSIGYVQFSYAVDRRLPAARIRNAAGRFIAPSTESVTAAAQGDMPKDARILITDTPEPDGYPISAFTYIIIYAEQSYHERTRERSTALIRFLNWLLRDGQRFNSELFYAPLPNRVVQNAMETLSTVRFDGRPLETPADTDASVR